MKIIMSKKYDIPNESLQEVGESVVAYANANRVAVDASEVWEQDDAPCVFSEEELRIVLLSSLEDKQNGRLHSHADVQSTINSRIVAWR